MTAMDYLSIVDGMNDQAFEYARELLFEHFNYRVMDIQQFRKVDLKEQLLSFADRVNNELPKKSTAERAFCNELIFYLESYFEYRSKSRAEQYYVRAKEINKKAGKNVATLDDLIDLTMIFLSVMRTTVSNINENEKMPVSAIDFSVYKTDGTVLKSFLSREFEIPRKIKNRIVDLIPDKLQDGADNLLAKYKTYNEKYFVYVNAVLILVIALQREGAFVAMEDE